MGLYTYWHNELQDIIRVDIVNGWTWSEYHKQIMLFKEAMQGAIVRGCIVDLRHTRFIPTQNALHHLRQMIEETPASVTVLVTDDDLLKQMVSVLQRAVKANTLGMVIVSTIEEAEALFNKPT